DLALDLGFDFGSPRVVELAGKLPQRVVFEPGLRLLRLPVPQVPVVPRPDMLPPAVSLALEEIRSDLPRANFFDRLAHSLVQSQHVAVVDALGANAVAACPFGDVG